MKAKRATKIALTTLCCAAIMSFGNVFAAENTTNYPVKTTVDGEDVMPFEGKLTFSADKPITDYAVGGDKIAFASYSSVYVLYTGENGDRKLDDEHPYSGSNRIERLDIKDGKLYLDVKSDGVFLYPEYNRTVEHEFPETSNRATLSTDEMYILANDGLHYYVGTNHENLGEGYANLKVFDDKAYAVKDNVLYSFNGTEPERVDVNYTDFSQAEDILCGDVAQKLKAANYEIYTTEILAGSYYTKINPDVIGGENDTFIPIHTEKAKVAKPCIVLCKSGNATVVATNEGMYITATDNIDTHNTVLSAQKNDWPLGSDGKRLSAYATENIGVYASPFMCKSTKIDTLESGAENHVEVIEKFEFNGVKFYKVRYEKVVKEGETDGTETVQVTGFVAGNMLTPYNFAAEDKEPHENGDKNFNYETNVVSVVLTIIIVALVLVAVMYISLIGTKKNRNKREKKKSGNREPENTEDYNEDEDE